MPDLFSAHHTSKTSLKAFYNPELTRARTNIAQMLEIAFNTYRDESFTMRSITDRINAMGFPKKLNYKQVQPRISELLANNKIYRTGKTIQENNIHVALMKFGHGNYVKRKTYFQIYQEEVEKRVNPDVVILIKKEVDRLFKYNKNKTSTPKPTITTIIDEDKIFLLSKEWLDSPNVLNTCYDKNSSTFQVQMKNFTTYQYFDVPIAKWEESKVAPSIGSWMHRNLKGFYRYARIT